MTIKKESYKEYDNSVEKVFVKHYDQNGNLIMINQHILTSKQHYNVDLYLNGNIKKTYGTYSEDFEPFSSYEVEYKYQDKQIEIFHYDVSFESKYYAKIFQELISKASLEGFNVPNDYRHLITKKKDYLNQKRELVKVEKHCFDEQGNIESKIINDLKNPERFQKEEFFYNNANQLIEIKYTSIKNSSQKLTAINLYTYHLTDAGNIVYTYKWKSYRDKFYIHQIEKKSTNYIEDRMFDGRVFQSKLVEHHEFNIDRDINEEYEYNDKENFCNHKLFNKYEELRNSIPVGFDQDEKFITTTKYFAGEIQEEIKTKFYKGSSDIISHKTYSHNFDKENLYFNKFDIKSEEQSCIVCFMLKPKTRLFSIKTFDYYI